MVATINPATGEELARYELEPASAVEQKLARAHERFGSWKALSFAGRAERFRALAAELERQQSELAALMTREMGKPISEARGEVTKCKWVCEHYAEHAESMLAPIAIETDASKSYVRHDPLGVILIIMPWNFPLWQVLRQAVPALMAGNTVLLKHAPNVWGTAEKSAELFRGAGFPEGAFQNLLVDVDAVETLLGDERVRGVSLTGSERAGRAVGGLAGRNIKPCVLELGGSDPFVVLADADLEQTVKGALTSRFLNTGQSCIAAKRFIVERPVLAAFRERFRAGIRDLSMGDPLDENVRVGPMARGDLRDQLAQQVEASVKAGATVLEGGRVPAGPGYFYPPTLLGDVVPGMPAFDEELFGPVAALVEARDREHAIELANRTRYGLGASIWSRDSAAPELAARIDAGCVAVNGIVKSDPRLPFGGTKASGIGRELARHGILEFVNEKTVWVA